MRHISHRNRWLFYCHYFPTFEYVYDHSESQSGLVLLEYVNRETGYPLIFEFTDGHCMVSKVPIKNHVKGKLILHFDNKYEKVDGGWVDVSNIIQISFTDKGSYFWCEFFGGKHYN